MKANCWHGRHSLSVEDVPDPTILNPARRHRADHVDGHLRVRPAPLQRLHSRRMRDGDVLGHEFMGEVVEVGREVKNLKTGDRVVVPFPIACGRCYMCQRALFSLCENSNPNAWMAEKLWGYSPAGIFGYSHMLGGYAGGQAEYARVPFADVGPRQDSGQPVGRAGAVPVRHLSRPATWPPRPATSSRATSIAVWGCGPVGQFAIKSAFLLGAERVIAIDRFPYRLRMAREQGRRRDDQLRRGGHLRRAQGDDGRPRSRRVHRRGRHGRPRTGTGRRPTTGSRPR